MPEVGEWNNEMAKDMMPLQEERDAFEDAADGDKKDLLPRPGGTMEDWPHECDRVWGLCPSMGRVGPPRGAKPVCVLMWTEQMSTLKEVVDRRHVLQGMLLQCE